MINEVTEGVIEQSSNEQIAYGVECNDYPSDPSAVVSVALYEITTPDSPTDVSTLLSGSASISGSVITTPTVLSLVIGSRYRLRVIYTGADANRYEVVVDIDCII